MTRTRFAPSPTGNLHIGNVRTALFAYLYARHMGGKFILRIEDTDLDRSECQYTDKLIEDLKWLGLEWDEGPDVGGEFAPYSQCERLDIYKSLADKLIDEGRAYHCYCTPEELETMKDEQTKQGKPPHYDGRCRHLTDKQKRDYEAEGRKPTVRFIAYDEDFSFEDTVKGVVNFPKGMVGDFVILRANGVPLYNYAVVVDDAMMKITNVMRADEHLSNTVRQLMIYKALGFDVPTFSHMALVLGSDKQKLSKRHGATSVEEFRNLGYLPEALINYLSLLGWSSPDGREILTKDELIKLFDINRLSPSPSIFDQDKLNWIAKHYIINKDIDSIYTLSVPFIKELGLLDDSYFDNKENEKFLKGVVEITRGYCSHLSEIKDYVDYFLTDDYVITEEAMPFLLKDTSKTVIEGFKKIIETEDRPVNEDVFTELAKNLMKTLDIKGKNFFMALRVALTGRVKGPEIYFLLPVIGKERAIKRLDRAIKIIGEHYAD